MRALLLRLSKARAEELEAALAAFSLFFTLLAAYYVLRPLRDEMALQLGKDGLQRTFDAVFLTMLAVVPAFGWLVRRFPRRRVLPWVYGFFVVNLLAFYAVMTATDTQQVQVARVFFVWVTVFSATGVSVFWSLMADLFSTEQAKRLYGFIAGGGATGALMGPAITVGLVHLLGPRLLVLVAAGLLAASTAATEWVRRAAERAAQLAEGAAELATEANDEASHEAARPDPGSPAALSASVWSGIGDVLRSPLLLGICAFLLLFSWSSTILYFETAELLPKALPGSAARTSLLAKVDGTVSLLSLLLQIFVFPRLVARRSLSTVLAAVPCLSVIGFAVLSAVPTLHVLIAFGVLRRAGEFAISKPAREMLFNALSPDEKYKAKNVIDTLVYRGGDELASRSLTGLRHVGISTLNLIWAAVPLSLLWAYMGWWLGKRTSKVTPPVAVSPPGTSAGT